MSDLVPKPTCCAAAKFFPAVVAGLDDSSEDTDECGARWYLQMAHPDGRAEMPGYQEWARKWPHPRTPEPTHCPFCGAALPKLVRAEYDVLNPVERVTDGGYYCDTCRKRCGWECECLAAIVRFRAEDP